MARFSKFGEHAGVWLALGAAGWRWDPRGRPARARWRRGAMTVLGAYVGNQAIKFTVRRPRPQLPDLPPLVHTMSQRSFPSAHATSSFAAARAYRGLLPRWLLYGLAGAMALSRPWLGVHYPSDVAFGALLGTAVAEVRGCPVKAGAGAGVPACR